MDWTTLNLEEILDRIWKALAIEGTRTPFRAAVLGTTGLHGCDLRTMVLQRTDSAERSLTCYSDSRTPKIRELHADPRVQWLLYDPVERVQIRAVGRATVLHGDSVAREAWRLMAASERGRYRGPALPGEVIHDPREAWATCVRTPSLETAAEDAGWENLAIIETVVDEFDWLFLHEAGFRRAQFRWTGSRFAGAWLVP